MLEIEAASIVDGEVVGDDLILTKHDASTINAGSVRGPQGDPGPTGSDLVVVTAQDLLAVGVSGQAVAGRQLTAADFTDMGLSAPQGLWNLGSTADVSGNGRTLTNKGSVAFTNGINGDANTAAQFTGAATKALYITDTGSNDPFRIKSGSVGCWFRTAKGGEFQGLVSKRSVTDGQHSWWLQIHNNNSLGFQYSSTGTLGAAVSAYGLASVTDDRWHFGVAVIDGARIMIYLDGRLDSHLSIGAVPYGGTAPLNIGGFCADGSNNAAYPMFGRIDEAFVTKDVLSEDQVRNLYCKKISHSLGAVPKRASLNVLRRRKGGALAVADFSATPLRLYNFSAGALTDLGSNNATLNYSGSPTSIAAQDGAQGNAFNFNGAGDQFLGTDTGLPSGTNTRSFGCWFRTSTVSNSPALLSWGSSGITTASQCLWLNAQGAVVLRDQGGNDITGPFVCDGNWHFVAAVEDNSAPDGHKRKLYLDGYLVAASLSALASITLSGANRFRLGMWADGAGAGVYYNGNMDSVFVCNYVMTPEEILKLMLKGSMALGVSPKNPGDHIELMTSSNLYCIFDSLEGQHQVNLAVA